MEMLTPRINLMHNSRYEPATGKGYCNRPLVVAARRSYRMSAADSGVVTVHPRLSRIGALHPGNIPTARLQIITVNCKSADCLDNAALSCGSLDWLGLGV